MNDTVIVIGNDNVDSDINGNDIIGVTLYDRVGSEITGNDIVDCDIIGNENLAVR